MPIRDPEQRRQYQNARNARKRAERGHPPALAPPPLRVEPVDDPAAALAAWSAQRLVVPWGHELEGRSMTLAPFAEAFLRDMLRPEVAEGLLCLARKNAKSASIAIALLGKLHPSSPIAEKGFRGGVVSVTKEKSSELWLLMKQVAEASELTHLRFLKAPRMVEGPYGTVDFMSADKASGHASGFTWAVVDELGLLEERSRALVSGMRSSTSARKGGKFFSMSFRGNSPMLEEMLERADDPAVVIHAYLAPDDARADDPMHGGSATPASMSGSSAWSTWRTPAEGHCRRRWICPTSSRRR